MNRLTNELLKKITLILSIIINIGILLHFKYLNFFIGELNNLLVNHQLPLLPWTQIIYIAGISFFTFSNIGFVVDVYRQRNCVMDRFGDYLLYVSFFPKLLQGPIEKISIFKKQINNTALVSFEERIDGLIRFIIGLSKKVLIADVLGITADTVFSMNIDLITVGYSWLGAICYSMQIYYDFSGYTDMAIGMSSLFGYRLSENFRFPYQSASFTDFWKRWHITLTSWFKDYLYIPLGGNRVSFMRNLFNLWLVFFVSGLWHGANWTFILWGVYHGIFLTLDKFALANISSHIHPSIKIIITFILIMIGWIIFRSPDMQFAIMYIAKLFSVTQAGSINTSLLLPEIISNRGIFIFFLTIFLTFVPERFYLYFIKANFRKNMSMLVCRNVFAILMLFLSFVTIVNNNFKPFLYFRF